MIRRCRLVCAPQPGVLNTVFGFSEIDIWRSGLTSLPALPVKTMYSSHAVSISQSIAAAFLDQVLTQDLAVAVRASPFSAWAGMLCQLSKS